MSISIPFRRKLAETLKGYTSETFFSDLVAGITMGIVATQVEAVRKELAGAMEYAGKVLNAPVEKECAPAEARR